MIADESIYPITSKIITTKNLCVLHVFTVQMSMGTLRLICLPTRSRSSESPAEWLELK